MFHLYASPEQFIPYIDGDLDITSIGDIAELTTNDIKRIRNTWVHPVLFYAIKQWEEVKNSCDSTEKAAALAVLMIAVASLTRPMTDHEVGEVRRARDEREKEVAVWEESLRRSAIAKELKIHPFPELSETDNRIIRYIVTGLSYREISRLVKLSASAIRKRALRYTALVEQCLAMDITER